MNIFFNRGFKKFPNNVYLSILYIIFNYSQKYNLNSVKIHLLKLKTIDVNINDNFLIVLLGTKS